MNMPECEETTLPAQRVRSLVWDGDDLVDWVSGGTRRGLNGETTGTRISYGDLVDAATASPDGKYGIIYTKLGTKGIVIGGGKIIREINRSYYHAEVYEYPVAIFRAKNGRYILAHCPDEYCHLELEDLLTGERLTTQANRKPEDTFHSRLTASPDGAYLLRAGWAWHPVDVVGVYDVQTALEDPSHLDGEGLFPNIVAEETSAAFLGNDRLLITAREYGEDKPTQLRVLSLNKSEPSIISETKAKLGNIMPVGETHVLGFYDCPKLIDRQSGAVLKTWPHVASGLQECAIVHEASLNPPIALDPARKRCAIADKEKITVLTFR